MNAKLRVVELWGGPGAGKSTTAAGLFYKLKLTQANAREKLSVELVHEAAKDVTWGLKHLHPHAPPPDEAVSRALYTRQAKIFAEQYERIARLRGQVDVVVSDSPLWLAVHYADQALYPREHWRAIVAAHYANLDVLSVWVNRVKPYEARGRNQTEAEARAIDHDLWPLFARVAERSAASLIVDGDERAPDEIVRRMRGIEWL